MNGNNLTVTDGHQNIEQELIEKLLTLDDAKRRLELAGPSNEERERMRIHLIGIISNFLSRLPSEEYDFLVLYYLESIPQRSIGNLFGFTQRAISYRIHRAIERLQFLIQITEVDEEQMREDLLQLFKDEEAVNIACRVFRVTNLSEVQRQEKSTFFFVRSRFYDLLKRLKEMDKKQLEPGLAERVESYIRCLDLVQANFGILNMRRKIRRTFEPFYLG